MDKFTYNLKWATRHKIPDLKGPGMLLCKVPSQCLRLNVISNEIGNAHCILPSILDLNYIRTPTICHRRWHSSIHPSILDPSILDSGADRAPSMGLAASGYVEYQLSMHPCLVCQRQLGHTYRHQSSHTQTIPSMVRPYLPWPSFFLVLRSGKFVIDLTQDMAHLVRELTGSPPPPLMLREWYHFVQGTLHNRISDVPRTKNGNHY